MVETDFGSCDLDVCRAGRKGKDVLLGKDLVWTQHGLEGKKSQSSFTRQQTESVYLTKVQCVSIVYI